jgi:hypothetical protein
MKDRKLGERADFAVRKLREAGGTAYVEQPCVCGGRREVWSGDAALPGGGKMTPCANCEGQGRTWSAGARNNSNQLLDRDVIEKLEKFKGAAQ